MSKSSGVRGAKYDYLLKLLLIGDSEVGKSCLLMRYAEESFTSSFITTIGIDFKIKTIDIESSNVKLQIWDTAGQERFRTLTTAYYRGAMGILVVYDVTVRSSFSNIRNWMRQVQQNAAENIHITLVGNKCDCDPSERKVTMEEGEALAEEYNAKFFEVSAKLNENVNECYNAAASDIVVKLKENPDFYGSVGEQKVKSGSEAKEKPKDKLKELMELYDMFVSRFEKGGWEDLEDWALSEMPHDTLELLLEFITTTGLTQTAYIVHKLAARLNEPDYQGKLAASLRKLLKIPEPEVDESEGLGGEVNIKIQKEKLYSEFTSLIEKEDLDGLQDLLANIAEYKDVVEQLEKSGKGESRKAVNARNIVVHYSEIKSIHDKYLEMVAAEEAAAVSATRDKPDVSPIQKVKLRLESMEKTMKSLMADNRAMRSSINELRSTVADQQDELSKLKNNNA